MDTLINAQIVLGTEEERLALNLGLLAEGTIFIIRPATPNPNPPVGSNLAAKAFVVCDVPSRGVRQWVEICCDAPTGP